MKLSSVIFILKSSSEDSGLVWVFDFEFDVAVDLAHKNQSYIQNEITQIRYRSTELTEKKATDTKQFLKNLAQNNYPSSAVKRANP